MKHSLFRGFFLGCFATLAAVLTLSMPATASAEPLVQVYELRFHDIADFLIVEPAAAVLSVQSETEAPEARTSIGAGPIAPVYLLAYRTFGQSLAGYHLRC